MSMNYTTFGASYLDAAYQFLSSTERTFNGLDLYPRDVKDGTITIGAGINMTGGERSNKFAVYRVLGIKVDLRTGAALTDTGTSAQQNIEQGYVTRLNQALSNTSLSIDDRIAQLHQTMTERAADNRLNGYADNRKAYFVFDPGTAGEQQIRQSFDEAAQAYEKKLQDALNAYDERITADSNFANSKEHGVLLSLIWNGGKGAIKTDLTRALSSGNRAEAWFVIRYDNNARGWAEIDGNLAANRKLGAGLAKRRFYEAEVFGLYSGTSDPAQQLSEAKDAYRMLQLHRENIFKYEAKYGVNPDGTLGERNMIAEANASYRLSGAAAVDTIIQAFTPARDTFITWANTLQPSDATPLNKDDWNAAAIFYNGIVGDASDGSVNPTLDARALDGMDGGMDKNLLVGATGDDLLFGGIGDDALIGQEGRDWLDGGADNDTLVGGAGNDRLFGGAGTDTYVFKADDGEDTIEDSDGLGQFQVAGRGALTGENAKLRVNEKRQQEWSENNGEVVYTLDSNKLLTISGTALGGGKISIKDFDVSKSDGYLGIKLNAKQELALTATQLTKNFWSDVNASIDTLAGQDSSLTEGTGKSFIIYLKQAAKEGETITLGLAGLADKFKAIFGDRTVAADGAVITLTEGQTEVSFALVQEGEVTADGSTQLSVTYQGDGESATSNSWGINLKDAGETEKTFNGDYAVRTTVSDSDIARYDTNGVGVIVVAQGQDKYVVDSYGNLVADANGSMVTDNVIFGTTGNDKINGLTGNDALDGGAGNDQIDGGGGDDLIGGGSGNDRILGGAGNDFISSSANLGPWMQQFGPNDHWRDWGLPPGKQIMANGATWGIYKDNQGGTDVTVWSGIGDTRTNAQSDVIDAGAGNDNVMASWGDDRVQGGAGDDYIDGLAGNDVLEGGDGNDNIQADGTTDADWLNTVDAASHGADFADGGVGNDTIQGGGNADDLFGGAGDDKIWGDSSGKTGDKSFVDLDYHGNDYLDGEDGNDYMEGGGKDDVLYGGAGNDNMWGDTSADNVSNPGDNALLWGNDYLDGEDGNDSLVGGGKDDVLYGGADDDALWGDESNIALDGESNGNDYLDGEDGNDQPIGGAGHRCHRIKAPGKWHKAGSRRCGASASPRSLRDNPMTRTCHCGGDEVGVTLRATRKRKTMLIVKRVRVQVRLLATMLLLVASHSVLSEAKMNLFLGNEMGARLDGGIK